ncbi:MAG: glycosyltransferase family 2 protein [Verrucomicrobia bacterium]|nr:glycosyltransferase family 2 protein [Verrucomicrobiota bacterium]MBS0637181.1 glycosyltransferase family 2 protein [Verrucomicrobiota bacterium]
MKKWILLAALFVATPLFSADKTVFVAILARNKAHVLPRYLRCLENQTYPKNLITIYIKTDNNSDNTKELLQSWVAQNRQNYKQIIVDDTNVKENHTTDPHYWDTARFQTLALIRNNSLKKAKDCDYYFVADCDNFIAPSTIEDLVHKDKPIIAPLLRCIPEPDDYYSNFFYLCNEEGYYRDHPTHIEILERKNVGVFKVDLVHCCYLVNTKYLNKLSYIDGTDDYEFIIFARSARKAGVEQYICNEKEYGVQVHFYNDDISLAEERRRLEAILTLP